VALFAEGVRELPAQALVLVGQLADPFVGGVQPGQE
jgi:hypothetical protein